jgi:hypothetical protein
MRRLWYRSWPLLLLLKTGTATAAVVIDSIVVKPNPAHVTGGTPAELEVEVAIRDRGVTRIMGCHFALDFGDGTPDLVQQFMDGGPRKALVRHHYRKPGTYNVRVRGTPAGRDRACEGEKRVQVVVVGDSEGAGDAVRETAALSLCPQGWSLIPGSQSGLRFKCRPDKPLVKIECQGGTKFFDQDGVIGCQ